MQTMAEPAATPITGLDTGLAAVLLRPLHGTNAFEATVEQLATAIRLGVFADGDRLPPERELAASLGVSRATLREAIAALRQAGLLVTRTGRGGGTAVSADDPEVVQSEARERRALAKQHVQANLDRYRDALVARRVIEPGAAFTAANRDLTPAQRDWLRAALDDVAGARGDVLHRQADSRFHLAIATLTGSARLLDLVTSVQSDLHDLLAAIPVLAVNIEHSNDEHTRIAEAILAGEPETARNVMESHCDASAALLRGLLGMDDMTEARTPRRDGTI
jgi:GntR family transcriptional repressor for pyruvate dehydrogenase complex